MANPFQPRYKVLLRAEDGQIIDTMLYVSKGPHDAALDVEREDDADIFEKGKRMLCRIESSIASHEHDPSDDIPDAFGYQDSPIDDCI